MNDFQRNLYRDLMTLCSDEDAEAFYYVDHVATDILGVKYSYRVFTYRLASYTDFQRPNAMECRGHTFLMQDDYSDMKMLASLPMQKFFNLGENPFTMNLDLSKVCKIMDKLDGSLISTVASRMGVSAEVLLKSKTSFASEQARAAMKLLCTEEYQELYDFCLASIRDGLTVNMEYMAPDNRIVIGYDKTMLRVLNVRSNLDGSYVQDYTLSEQFKVQTVMVPADPVAFVESIAGMTGIEGYILQLECGQLVKIKTEAYCLLHKTKDSITTPRKLFEVCVHEGGDDLRSMFAGDVGALNLILDMETRVAKIYNHLHKELYAFYNANKHLDRKDYAIKGTAELAKDGIFGLAMNLYLGKETSIKDFMVKHYRDYGITDEPVEAIVD